MEVDQSLFWWTLKAEEGDRPTQKSMERESLERDEEHRLEMQVPEMTSSQWPSNSDSPMPPVLKVLGR